MRLVDIIALTGNIAVALYGVEDHLEHVEIGRETPTLDAAEAEIRALADALAKVLPGPESCVLMGSIDVIRTQLAGLPRIDRHDCERRILVALTTAVKGFADLVEELHLLSLEQLPARRAVTDHQPAPPAIAV
jgi:hypothetical protein